MPAAQVFEHADQELHLPTTQSTGQACLLHAREDLRSGHALPPYATFVLMLRALDCVPEPQDLLQLLQALHVLTTQSTGHACLLQSCV